MTLFGNLAEKDRGALRGLAAAGGIAFAVVVIAYMATVNWHSAIPRDAIGAVLGRDFLNFWMYGHAAWLHDPARFYDVTTYNNFLRAALGNDLPLQDWSYPPHLLLVAAPFGFIGYLPALVLWFALTAGVFYFAAARQMGSGALPMLILIGPAAVLCFICGQSSFLTTAALIAIFTTLDRRPMIAGILIGLLTLKPQLGILIPVMLIASGRWKVLAAATLATAMLVAATAAAFGWGVWQAWLTTGLHEQALILRDTHISSLLMIPTTYMNLHVLGASYPIAMGVQAIVTLLSGATVFWAFRHRADADPLVLQALFFACAAAATPYLMCYDAMPLGYAAVALLARGKLDHDGRRLALLCYWLPFIQIALG